ncbi:TPA: hypothetical protein DEP81_01335 [Candidatus Woesebacteria bacterium]|nr:hypothetical protein [Candidatus Woesebacteria bacterium]
MQKLQDGLKLAIADESGAGELALFEVGKQWAIYSLDTYTGELLSKALDISKAIADFTLELKEPGNNR